MIAYLAVPFAFGDLGSINSAIQMFNHHAALFMKHNKGSAVVNPLFGVYNSDKKTNLFTEHEFYVQAKSLLDAANAVIVLQSPNWGYSEVTRNELSYAYFIKKNVHYLEPIPNVKQELSGNNTDSSST